MCLPISYANLPRPSLGLGMIQSALKRAGIPSRALFANLWWAEEIGLDLLNLISNRAEHDLVGEFTFSKALFREQAPPPDEFLAQMRYSHFHRHAPDVPGQLLKARDLAVEFVDRCARRILELKPRIVGCTSTFEQHCASLALLRRIRELDPEVVTLLGGANCEGEMGFTALQQFDWLDLVVSGEADQLIVPLMQELLEHGRGFAAERLPHGVMTRDRKPAVFPRATVLRLDELAPPDFDDYFAQMQSSPLRDCLQPALALESSRGCWWGAKHHCTFCGLNGNGMAYRSKDADRVVSELAEMAERYGLKRFNMVDNILDMAYFETVLPRLEGAGYTMFFETKANLRAKHLEQLKRAGVGFIQPGIESLHDEVLKLFDKGTTALINLQLLRKAREFGIQLVWLFLTNTPGEKDEWCHEMADLVPLLLHLQPPNLITRVRYDRFSPYHSRPADYGLSIVPNANYARIFPLERQALQGLAYFFEDDLNQPLPQGRELDRDPSRSGRDRLETEIRRWIGTFWRPNPPILSLRDQDQELFVYDTRPMRKRSSTRFVGVARQILLACDEPRSAVSLEKELNRPLDESEVEEALTELRELGYLLFLNGKYLTLGVSGSLPSLPGLRNLPTGSVVHMPSWMQETALAPG